MGGESEIRTLSHKCNVIWYARLWKVPDLIPSLSSFSAEEIKLEAGDTCITLDTRLCAKSFDSKLNPFSKTPAVN